MRHFFHTMKALVVAMLLASASFVHAAPQHTQASVRAISPIQAAPDPTVHLHPLVRHDCGLFETCTNTRIGLGKGDFIIRLSAIGVITNNTSTSINAYNRSSGALLGHGGDLTINNNVAPEFTFEYFLTDHLSIDLIAASTHHTAHAHNVAALGGASANAGSFWILPPTLTLAYHFRPHKRFNPYAGIGLTVAIFHNTSSHFAGFNDIHPRTTVGPSFNVGFDYQLVGNWFANMDVKQMLLNVPVRINGTGPLAGVRIHARSHVNPTVVGAGIGYRF